ncbi:MAG: DUF308 domain-containing protein [Clostridia bacterium]|nr:DUF308 domain-containing protein [Clostridia bacterium]
MDKISKLIYTVKNNPVYLSAFFIAFGLILLLFPGATLDILCAVFGIIITIKGILNIVEYSRAKTQNQSKLIFGIIEIIAGLNFVMISYLIVSFISSVFGIYVMYNGSKQFQKAMESKKYNDKNWVWMAVLSVITIIFGFVMIFIKMFLPTLIIKIIGLCLIYNGITNFIIASHMKKEQDSLIDDDEI